MIFNVPMHIAYIRNGLSSLPADNLNLPIELRIVKTQTRRLNRGIYKVGKDYAVQRKRGVKAEPDIRIVMDQIREESLFGSSEKLATPHFLFISKEDALAEGGYTPEDYEWTYRKINPKWQQAQWTRWAFEFHVIEVRR